MAIKGRTSAVGTPWFIRQAIYLVTLVVGLVAVVFGIASPGDVDAVLSQVASVAAVLGGGLAAANTGRESDEGPKVIEVPVVPAEDVPERDPFTAFPEEI